MILFFAGIITGIAIGIGGSLVVYLWQDWEGNDAVPDLAEIMGNITPEMTPFLSEIERHRAKHLAAKGGSNDRTGLHRGSA
jgi:hypothetical protein